MFGKFYNNSPPTYTCFFVTSKKIISVSARARETAEVVVAIVFTILLSDFTDQTLVNV